MPQNPQEFAALFGAKLIGEVPDTGAGPFGIARLAHIMHQRLTPGQGERPGRPTDATWDSRPKVPMSALTRQYLDEIAKLLSSPERQVSPMQVAAQLLEEAVCRVKKPVAPGAETKKNGDGAAATAEDSDLHEAKVKNGRPAGQRAVKRRPKPAG